MIDCHIHSIWSDGEDKLEEIVKEAVSKGLKVIGFSDHAFPLDAQKEYINPDRVKYYLEKIDQLKRDYNGMLKVLGGIEVDYSIGHKEEIRDLLSGFNLDFILASIHQVDLLNKNISLWDYREMNSPEAIASYFRNIYSAVKSGIFDCIAHPELIRQGVNLPIGSFDKLGSLCKESGVAFEINSAGLTRDVYNLVNGSLIPQSRYPNQELMKALVEKGVNLTIGSDAHKIEYVGGNIIPVIKSLKEAGAKEVCYIESRKKIKFQI